MKESEDKQKISLPEELTEGDLRNLLSEVLVGIPVTDVLDTPFSIKFSINKEQMISIQVHLEYDSEYISAISELLHHLTLGSLNLEILSSLALKAGTDVKNKRFIKNIVRSWEEKENKPYISPLQTRE